ncbi:MAG: hypothetical protein KTR31_41895 [Myxococcales bacterium]|nr:hypothetical protein [Myxococcales bacterium]
MTDTDGSELFWALAEPLLKRDDTEKGTMMGHACLRRAGQFFAMVDGEGHQLIAKLPAARVVELVEVGIGQPFAPAGRTFREWVAVPVAERSHWEDLLAEAHAFAA